MRDLQSGAARLSSPNISKRLKQLLDDKGLVAKPSAAGPIGEPRVVIADEVDT